MSAVTSTTSKPPAESIRELAAEGKTYMEICDELGLTYSQAYAIARSNNIAVSRKTKVDKALDKIKRLASEGVAPKVIAESVNLTTASVYNAMKANDIEVVKPEKVKPVSARKTRLAEIKRLHDAGNSSSEIAHSLGIGRQMLLKDMRTLGITVKDENHSKKEQRAQDVRRLAEQGMVSGEIAEELNLSADVVRITARKFNISIPLVKPIEHGTLSAYTSRGCRCDQCVAVNSERVRQYKESLKSREMPDDLHGTDNGYRNWGCRCKPCKDAGSLTNKKSLFLDAPSERSSARWTPKEDLMVSDRSMTARELALKLGRSVAAVHARRAMLSASSSSEASSAMS